MPPARSHRGALQQALNPFGHHVFAAQGRNGRPTRWRLRFCRFDQRRRQLQRLRGQGDCHIVRRVFHNPGTIPDECAHDGQKPQRIAAPPQQRDAHNEARRDYNKVIPLAEGEKDQRIREADGYRLKRINEAEGDAARFSALLAEYAKAPEVTLRRIYIETLQDVLPGIRSKVIIDEQTKSILPFLNLEAQKAARP
jgi:hypothetical protein